MPGRAASNSRFPTGRQKPAYTSSRLLIPGLLAALALLVVLGALRSGESGGREITYRGERYESAARADDDDVALARAVATGDKIDGQDVYAEPRTPPRVVFLLRADRDYDAFVLVAEDG